MEKEKKPLSDTVRDMLQLFVDSDQKIYGAISDDTLQALQVQGYRLNQGVVEKNRGGPLTTLLFVPIERRLMKLDVKAHKFNMQEIENRRKHYPDGVIHFAPNIDSRNIPLFEKGFDTLEMFSANGARDKTVVRAFGDKWEQLLSSLLRPERETEQKVSIRRQLKETVAPKNIPPKKTKQQQER